MSNISIVIGREFNERVRKKSFIITTLLMPVLLIALMAAPALILQFSRGETKRIAVIDESGLVLPRLESDADVEFEAAGLSVEEARRELTDRFGVLWIGADVLSNPGDVKLYANSSSSLTLEEGLSRRIEEVLEAEKLKRYDIENLAQILDEVKTTVTIQTFRNDESQEEDAQAKSSAVSAFMGFGLGMVLYMFLLIYGAMVMQSVIEEKNSRVLEVVVSSVRPFDLMMGKILGIACVAVVQILLWAVLVVGIGALVMPRLMPADLMANTREAMQSGALDTASAAAAAGVDPGMLHAVATAMDFGYVAAILSYLLLFLVGGYLLYSAMFAAVGSSVDNIRRPAAPDPHHDSDRSRLLRGHVGDERSQFVRRLLVLDHPLHFAHRDDRPHPLRHSRMGDPPLARAALRIVRGDGVARSQDLPGGHLHVRQETVVQGALQVAAL